MSGSLFVTVLEMAGESPSTPAELAIDAGERIVAIGDSITQNGGYLRAIDAVFAQQYPARAIPPILNVGVSGQRAEDMVMRFERDVVRHRPAVATLSVGINDVWHRLESPDNDAVLADYARNVERMVERALEAGIRFYLLAPTVIEEDPASEGNRRLARYVDANEAIAARWSCESIDLHDLFLRAVVNRQGPVVTGDASARYFTRDGVHMEPPGDVLMAIGVLRAWGVPDEKMAATDSSGVFP